MLLCLYCVVPALRHMGQALFTPPVVMPAQYWCPAYHLLFTHVCIRVAVDVVIWCVLTSIRCAGLKVAVLGQGASAWEVRNAAGLAFAAVLNRVLGFRNQLQVSTREQFCVVARSHRYLSWKCMCLPGLMQQRHACKLDSKQWQAACNWRAAGYSCDCTGPCTPNRSGLLDKAQSQSGRSSICWCDVLPTV